MSKKKSTKKRGQYQVVLIDDNVNTFDHVIECLIEICGHNYFQAIQSALITHNVKQCSVFVDDYDLCTDICSELVEDGLNAIVTKYKSL
jgi:ATP-dependent Clp protease adaptor protein ClpS